MKKTLLPILILITFQLFAQKHEVGIQTAYGRSLIDEKFNSNIYTTFWEFDHYLRLGFSYHFTPEKSIFSFKSGLNYEAKWLDYNIHFLKIPLGIDFQIGKKYQVVFGGGIYGSVLIGASANEISSSFEERKNRFQFGAYFSIGIGYQINEKYNIRVIYMADKDISNLYTRNYNHHGGTYTSYYKSFNRFLQLGLKYNLSIKKDHKNDL